MFYSVHVSAIHLLMTKTPTSVMQDVHKYYKYLFIDLLKEYSVGSMQSQS